MNLETEQKYRTVGWWWTQLCRALLGVTFLFSGFVKAVDPLGSFYKIQDYLTAFGMGDWLPYWLPLLAAVGLAAVEFAVGVFLCLGMRRIFASSVALLLMSVMTPLTFYLALADPVSDCGCFGDAWVLTNWQTFGKNLLLLPAAVTLFRRRRVLKRFVTLRMEWLVSTYTFLFIFALSFYCLYSLPILDFRPYKVGADIRAGMEVPPGQKLSVLETRFVMEKEGKRREFTIEEYPDSTWQWVETRTVVKEKGYEPPIHDFVVEEIATGEDITDSLLADPGYTFLLVMYRLDQADDSHIDLINEIYDYSVEHGYGFRALTASSDSDIEEWCDRTGAEYAFCRMDDVTLKTIIRSNPGLLLLKEGVIVNKWSHNRLPDEYVLTDRLENLPLGQPDPIDTWRTMGGVLLWFLLPLLPVIALDRWLARRREKKTIH